MKIIYSPESLDDLIRIYSYISTVLLEPDTAEAQVNHIRDNIRKLDNFPFRHKVVDWEPWHTMGMRLFPVNNYDVYYLVNEDQTNVQIVRIFYSGRDVENIIKIQLSDRM